MEACIFVQLGDVIAQADRTGWHDVDATMHITLPLSRCSPCCSPCCMFAMLFAMLMPR
jgi:hypothetical protein